MTKRSYGQDCALALGLDVIGERWTLLIIRGLLTGPKRYSELLDQLQGMGTNLLATRLRELVEHGIAHKTDAGYALTGRGEALRPIVHDLIRWGHQFRYLVPDAALSRPEWDMLALEAAFRPERAHGVDCTIDLTLSGFRFHIVIRDQSARCHAGSAESADAIAATTTETLQAIAAGQLSSGAAMKAGKLDLQGSRRVFRQLFRLFELPGS
jgi:DNA-binding HxlR family transcriptional regulator/putative sterol carrier protein